MIKIFRIKPDSHEKGILPFPRVAELDETFL